jgi:hypothetical protein
VKYGEMQGESRLGAVAARPLSPAFFDTRSQVEAFAFAPPQIDVARPVEWSYPFGAARDPGSVVVRAWFADGGDG